MPSGWTRWLFEQYEMPFSVVYPQTLDAGDLKSKFDVLVFVGGAIRGQGGFGGRGGGGGGRGGAPAAIPDEYKGWTGSITEDKTMPQLRKFVELGGTIVTIGSSTTIARRLRSAREELPHRDGLRRQRAHSAGREVLHSRLAAEDERR